MIRIEPGLRMGRLRLPQSKSHAHRVLIADFLAGGSAYREVNPLDCDDIVATKRCLAALFRTGRVLAARDGRNGVCSPGREDAARTVSLPVGESGTTRRLLGPVVAALGLKPDWRMEGRLASRPQIEYAELSPGVHELPGDVSSQFVSGLLLALPLLAGDSEIRLSSPLASRGYVDMTLDVLKTYGVGVEETEKGFLVPAGRYVLPGVLAGREHYGALGREHYGALGRERSGVSGRTHGGAAVRIEADWSGAAFPLALRALGNEIEFSMEGLCEASRQPDCVVREMLERMTSFSHATGMSRLLCEATPEETRHSCRVELDRHPLIEETRHSCRVRNEDRPPLTLDVDECPDLFPVLTVVAAAQPHVTRFTGIRRLRLKESDRVAAMADVLARFGIAVDVSEDAFVVHGTPAPFSGGDFTSYADHRIAMSIAVGATRASAPVTIDNETCAAKSYPTFFEDFAALKEL